MTYTTKLDHKGRRDRQRKVRQITQDTREPDPITTTMLTGAGYTVERKSMITGDYAWDVRDKSLLTTHYGFTRVIVERKTLADMRDVKRLMSQVARMKLLLGQQVFCIVLIEYKFDTDVKRKWTEQAINMAKLSIQMNGVKVTECEANQVAQALDHLYKWSQKAKHELIGVTT